MMKVFFALISTLFFVETVAQEARLYKENEKWGLLNSDRKRITLPIYDQIIPGAPYSVVKKFDPVSSKFLTGCVDASGQIIIPPMYVDLKVEGLRIIACLKNQQGFVYGIINNKNEVILPIQYAGIRALGTLRFAVENFAGKTALFTENGKPLTEFSINKIYPYTKDLAIFEEQELLGMLDREGNIKLKAEFRDLQIREDGSVWGRKENTWSWVDSSNKTIQSLQADSIEFLSNDNFIVKRRSGNNLYNKNLQPISPAYPVLKKSTNTSLLLTKNIQSGVLDLNGKELIPMVYDSIAITSHFIYGLRGKEWFLLNPDGAITCQKSYEQIKPLEFGFTAAKKHDFWGAVDLQGKEVLACVYDTVLASGSDRFVVKFKGNYGIISATEEWLLAPQHHLPVLINEKNYLLRDHDLLTLKNYQHTTLYFTNNPLIIRNDSIIEYTSQGEIWHVSPTGFVTNLQQRPLEHVSSINSASEGYRAIRKDGKWGFVDLQGRLRIPNRYDLVRSFSEGLAAFSLVKKWGFLNHDDQIIIHPSYEEVGDFIQGFSVVKQKGKYGIINKTNEIILPCRYDKIERLPSGDFQLMGNGMYGLANNQGILQYEPKYTSQQEIGNVFLVGRNSVYGIIDPSGINVLPLMYDWIQPTQQKNIFLVLSRKKWLKVL